MIMASHQAVLLSTPYLPSVTWFVKVWSNHTVWWDLDQIADKRRPLNRCVIATAQGAQTLSVPLLGGRNQRVKVSELKLLNDIKWKRAHMHALQTAYGKSPYFIHYADDLFKIIQRDFETLAQLNIALIQHLLTTLRIKTTVSPAEKLADETQLGVHKAVRYPQVFEDKVGFIPDCSVVDLLFNCGPDSVQMFKQATR
jgi:hypothetical protein